MSMCLLLECPFNRTLFIETEGGISIFLDILSGTNIIHKELAISRLLYFQYCKDSLKVSIIQIIIYYSDTIKIIIIFKTFLSANFLVFTHFCLNHLKLL